MSTGLSSFGNVDSSASFPLDAEHPLSHPSVYPRWQLGDQDTVSVPSGTQATPEDLLGHLAINVEDTPSTHTNAQAGNSAHFSSVDELHQAETSPADNSDSGVLASASSNVPPGDIEDLWEDGVIRLDSLKVTVDFIKGICNATLDDPNLGLSVEAIN
ncbi:hypothetical protein BC827DRAFT_1273714 [Russula dissimulans]|jgi:hypothetical protein|nr:hypothetical protein BC827DRAFT_1273714 [Russula dissimulans]